MDLRAYLSTDREACLAIFDSNAPDFFSAGVRADFAAFLDRPATYFVMEHDGAAVGCGGYEIKPGATEATLVWGMVHRNFHRKGLGRFLLMYRLREIGKSAGIERVHLQAPKASAPFFQTQGFKPVSEASGQVDLVKKLTVCS